MGMIFSVGVASPRIANFHIPEGRSVSDPGWDRNSSLSSLTHTHTHSHTGTSWRVQCVCMISVSDSTQPGSCICGISQARTLE